MVFIMAYLCSNYCRLSRKQSLYIYVDYKYRVAGIPLIFLFLRLVIILNGGLASVVVVSYSEVYVLHVAKW